ncbi:IS5 family transposase [Streptomyces sp. NPDC059875]|uniref:IS5 family transposase n=1 Tax=unclassified Streptomyces TaxID=2593676 RepID=UPI003652689E
MTDREWAQVRAAMPVPGWLEGRGGQPESYCHRQMIDAIRFLVDNGIKWRAMPVDFPAWHRVYVFFRRWRDKGLVKEFHDRLRGKTRAAAGRGPEPTAGIIDSQSVKAAASVPASSRGFEGGKKINGRKRHIVVDTTGLLLTVMVTAANVTDREAAQVLLTRLTRRFFLLRAGLGRRRLHRSSGRLRREGTASRTHGRQTRCGPVGSNSTRCRAATSRSSINPITDGIWHLH